MMSLKERDKFKISDCLETFRRRHEEDLRYGLWGRSAYCHNDQTVTSLCIERPPQELSARFPCDVV